jgi:hypothetical protein
MAVRLSALCTSCPLCPRKIPGTHSCKRLSWHQGHSAAGRIRSIEKFNDLMGIRSWDLPPCSIMPQPTMLPCAPTLKGLENVLNNALSWSKSTQSTHLFINDGTVPCDWHTSYHLYYIDKMLNMMFSWWWLWRLLSSGMGCHVVW